MLMLIGFPFVSWYYLTGGIDYRKTALKELESKIPFNFTELLDSSHQDLNGKLLLIDFNASNESFDRLYNQFNKAPEFNMISINSKDEIFNLSVEEIERLKSTYPGSDLVLIDAQGMERKRYVDKKDDLQLLVKHIATLLPVIEKKKEKYNSKS